MHNNIVVDNAFHSRLDKELKSISLYSFLSSRQSKMSFGLRRNTRIREDTLHNATEDGRYKAKQLQQERKVKEYKDTIEKLEKKK